MEQIKRKINFLLLKLTFFFTYTVVYLFSTFFKRKNSKGGNLKIAAIWYNPHGLTGSNLRMGEWKKYFAKDGYEFDNYYACEFDEYLTRFERGSWSSKYNFYRIILLRRLRHFFLLYNYDIAWVDRGFLPFYPLKNPFFEKSIKKLGVKLVVDSTDGGDFQLNPKLVFETLYTADRITVAYKYLNELYGTLFQGKVHWINWTIPEKNYIVKKNYCFESKPIIGWMGSPGNAKAHLLPLKEILEKVSIKVGFKLVYICRERLDFQIPNLEIDHKTFEEDYYDLIASFDIGICPSLEEDISTKGKIAMKNQEFMLCGIPQVCSPIAISEYLQHDESAMIAENMTQWELYLKELMTDREKREKIGKKSLEIFRKHYLYDSEYVKLRNVLIY